MEELCEDLEMDYTSIRIKNYKLFDDVVLSDLKRVNIIIGKNNSGKSSLIDAVAAAYDCKQYSIIQNNVSGISVGTNVTRKMVESVFNGRDHIGHVYAYNYIQNAVGREIIVALSPNGNILKTELDSEDPIINELRNYWSPGLQVIESGIWEKSFRRMRADRDIVPETAALREVSETGKGSTNLVRKVLTEDKYKEDIIEKKLLEDLNEIFYPDGEFETIRIQQIDSRDGGTWEIFLQEKGQSRIPLSNMGSGLKTILLILLNIIVIPALSKGKKYAYAFEEIENNLHPALQRRIFEYLYKFAVSNDTVIFITTHSHVAINCFYDKEQASIYHIEKIKGKASLYRIETYLDKAEILSDLDVRASDLLQSNGIIWVEGPSDRVYIKRWLELFTNNEFVEGQHYQFAYYGGRILSHYTLGENDKLINILKTNRNAAIIIDSDKKNKQAHINATKKRIVEEFQSMNSFSWITKGKEIENYIPPESIEELTGKKIKRRCGQYDIFPNFIVKYYPSFNQSKVSFANEVVSHMKKPDCEKMYDLQEMIIKLYKCIEGWNA